MKFKLFVIWFVLIAQTTFSQTVTQEDFENVFDYYNCEFIKYSIETTLKKGDLDKLKAEKSSYDTIISEVINQNAINKPVQSDVLINILTENNWKWTSKYIYEEICKTKVNFNENWTKKEVIDFFSSTIYDQPINVVIDKGKVEKKVLDYKRFKGKEEQKIYDNIKKYLDEKYPDEVEQSKEEDVTTNKDNKTEKTHSSDLARLDSNINTLYNLIITIVIGIILLIGVGVFLFLKTDEYNKKINGRIERRKKDIERIDNTNANTSSSIALIKQDIANLKIEIAGLNSRSATIKPENKKTETMSNNKTYNNQTFNPSTTFRHTFYMRAPNKETGNFGDSNKSDKYIATETIYKFTLISEKEAKFEFISDEKNIRVALDFYDRYIEPVCEESNKIKMNATSITTISQGVAVLTNNGEWIIKQKAKIRYD